MGSTYILANKTWLPVPVYDEYIYPWSYGQSPNSTFYLPRSSQDYHVLLNTAEEELGEVAEETNQLGD